MSDRRATEQRRPATGPGAARSIRGRAAALATGTVRERATALALAALTLAAVAVAVAVWAIAASGPGGTAAASAAASAPGVPAAGHATGEPASKMNGSTAMGSMDMGGASTSSGAGASAGSTDAKIDFAATPVAGWHAFSAALAPAPGGRVHHLTLVAQDRRVQVAPGVTQDRWTFAGQVPAPTLRGHIGDVFEVTLVNHTDMAHSIDFHAAGEPMQAMRQVAPGRSVTYQFKARYSGIFLYHCGTAPVLMHLANGMYGAVIIDPPGLPRVAHEFLLVQSELYLGPEGQSGDYSKMLHNTPDAVVFNGYSNQYLYSPLHVRVGQTVRIWVLDAGPNDEASFHVVGAPFTTVYKEGAYLLRPGPLHGASQALDLSPGQGGFVQFTPAAPGEYELIDHQLDHAATGADGYLIARR